MESREIRPGHIFRDDRGNVAQLHGVGVLRIGDRYWAWGEDKTRGGTFTAVACYSSSDLAQWRLEGDALTASTGDLASDRVIERPKVLQRPDGMYVMFLHVDSADYRDARVGFAISAQPQGPFDYRGSVRPLGNESRDIGVFQDGADAYLLSEDRPNGLAIYKLANDYLSIESLVVVLATSGRIHPGWESPALIRENGIYYLLASDLTGWNMNDNVYATSSSLHGPWSEWMTFAPSGSNTFESQVSFVLPVQTDSGVKHVYIGDRWIPSDLAESPSVWLPLTVNDGSVSLRWRDSWSLNDL